MKTDSLPLKADNPAIRLDVYLLHDSPEFQTGQRRPAVIVCPGGGYLGLSEREAEPIALRFLAQGYHAFVLWYSIRTLFPAPMLDLARAILTIRANAEAWRVAPEQIAVCGFSAGGHLAASLGVFWDKPFIYEAVGASPERIRPNALLLAYPLIDLELIYLDPNPLPGQRPAVQPDRNMLAATLGRPDPAPEQLDQYCLDRHVSAATPPAFIWHTSEDQQLPVSNVLRFAGALEAHRVPYELHIFERGEHGLALADEVTAIGDRLINPEAQLWLPLALNWLRLRRNVHRA